MLTINCDACWQCGYLILQRVCSICFLGHGVPVGFLREDCSANLQETGVAQSLILEDVLPFSRECANGEVMLQGVKLGHTSVLLHIIYIFTMWPGGWLCHSWGKTFNPYQGCSSHFGKWSGGSKGHFCRQWDAPSLLPACAVIWSMAKRKESETTEDDEEVNNRQEIVVNFIFSCGWRVWLQSER